MVCRSTSSGKSKPKGGSSASGLDFEPADPADPAHRDDPPSDGGSAAKKPAKAANARKKFAPEYFRVTVRVRQGENNAK